ncbi:lysophospholipid acyltransferase family protein [Desulfuromonas thiophila]|uniref:lysophospholipid acyltransferase family protein n=1 Tax=Desulfuromonas thiophila TaxID=57664 RepID=UPI0024A845B3|nr:lysophospholipid acyltransferase family protein [Desulfuromonas thiophila]
MKAVVNRLLLWLAPPLAAVLIRCIHYTSRCTVEGADQLECLWRQGHYAILSSWHDQLLLLVRGYGGQARILISPSFDGELIARTMACFGHQAVRGSSSRGGRAAFRQLLQLARQPGELVITPDGPRGPRHQIKEGVVQLARLSRRPVVPLALACNRGHRFASWDRFLLPYPFGRLVYVYGEPLWCGADEPPQVFHARLTAAMAAASQRARQILEAQGVSAV